jgi:glycosyltransferase involved in cell wall biosynthesis
MQNKLILFTADFPFGTGETFLETEIKYLAEGFDEVLIISQNSIGQQTREIPANCEVRRINLSLTKIQKLQALFNFFDPLFWKERSIIKSIYHIPFSKGIITTKLISLTRGKRVKKYTKKLLAEEKNDNKLFLYSYWCDDVALGIAMAQKENSEISSFCRMHGWDVYFEASSINYLPYRHFIADNLKTIYAISQKGIDYALKTWHLTEKNVFELARLGVENQHKIENDPADFILVSCSNVIPLKRVDLIVRALAQMKETNITWVHFGDGPQLENVKDLAKEKLPMNIKFDFKGRISNQEIIQWYNKYEPSLFINVSTSEGIPVSIMEAMSFGIPVIATNVGGNSEIVNSENGYLVEANISPADLAITIESFVELPLEKKEFKQQASFNTWRSKYNASDNFRQFVQTIQDL